LILNFESSLEKYAELLVIHGLNVQSGQSVNISAEVAHRDLVCHIARACYKKGAKHVNIDLADPRFAKIRITESDPNNLSYVPQHITQKYNYLLDTTAANLKLVGSEEPDILSDLDPQKINTLRLATYMAIKRFYEEGIGKSKIHWTVAAAATPKWAKKIFPKLAEKEAVASLWNEIFKICRVDKPNCLELWQKHNDALHSRATKLSLMKIKELHFTGPGTDLHVFLSPKALFKGGGDLSPRGVEFEPNVPTEEVFTTPDYRKTSGKVTTTRPFLINGKLIKGLYVEFTNGEISNFKAEDGEATFKEYINSDEGGKRLGEVALVGIDSPVYQSGLVFEEILFDENAACHIAIGSAYKFCLENGANLTQEELADIGCNESSVHTDMMISSDKVNVDAITYSGTEVRLISNGQWEEGF
jgi:aminopeptidase